MTYNRRPRADGRKRVYYYDNNVPNNKCEDVHRGSGNE